MKKYNVQIVATIGPASAKPEVLKSMIANNLGAARLNFSWGNPAGRAEQINLIRKFAKEAGRNIPIIIDLPGPRMQKSGSHFFDQNSTEVITPHDIEFIKFAAEHNADYVAVSYVGGPEDIEKCRKIIATFSGHQKIIAKIERKTALGALGEIIAVSDAVMVARGDLGNEVPIEEIPFIQAEIIKKAKAAGKPVIVATQMLLSMTENSVPTRAEVTDVTDAILEGADAVMLSEETARGRYPVEAVAEMEKIIIETKRHVSKVATFSNLDNSISVKRIKSVSAREILDSRGNPTLEVTCELGSGSTAKASVPSGASTGRYEALELRDHDEGRYGGLGVEKAVRNVNIEINNFILGKEFSQVALDQALIVLDGTENKSRLGANAILGVSLAFARACAEEEEKELYEYIGFLAGNKVFKIPQPMLNVINGGKHADSGLNIQEFMIAPVGFKTLPKKIEAAALVISNLRKLLLEKGYAISLGDEGGFAPKLSSNEEAFELLCEAIKNAKYSFDQVKLGIDAAASTFFRDGAYQLKEGMMKSGEMVNWYKELVRKYPIMLIEDGLGEDDWQGFVDLTEEVGGKIIIVGDDLTVTNVNRIKTAIEKKAVNSILIKLNQIGTLTETIEAVKLTKEAGLIPFVSHRSGETTDTFIADLAVGLACDYIKAGSLSRGERVCKYDRLMEIEDTLRNT